MYPVFLPKIRIFSVDNSPCPPGKTRDNYHLYYQEKKTPPKSGAFFTQFHVWCSAIFTRPQGLFHSRRGRARDCVDAPAAGGRQGVPPRPDQPHRRHIVSESPRPGNRGGGCAQRARGRGSNFPRAGRTQGTDAPPPNRIDAAEATRTPARAHRAPGRGHSRRKAGGAGDSRAASEAPPGSQNPQRRRHRPEIGAQRTRAPHDGAPSVTQGKIVQPIGKRRICAAQSMRITQRIPS